MSTSTIQPVSVEDIQNAIVAIVEEVDLHGGNVADILSKLDPLLKIKLAPFTRSLLLGRELIDQEARYCSAELVALLLNTVSDDLAFNNPAIAQFLQFSNGHAVWTVNGANPVALITSSPLESILYSHREPRAYITDIAKILTEITNEQELLELQIDILAKGLATRARHEDYVQAVFLSSVYFDQREGIVRMGVNPEYYPEPSMVRALNVMLTNIIADEIDIRYERINEMVPVAENNSIVDTFEVLAEMCYSEDDIQELLYDLGLAYNIAKLVTDRIVRCHSQDADEIYKYVEYLVFPAHHFKSEDELDNRYNELTEFLNKFRRN